MRYLVALLAVVGLLYAVPSRSAECLSIAQDREKVEKGGRIHWLGVRDVPYTDNMEFVYYELDGLAMFSPVFNGCVAPNAFPLGSYVPEVSAALE
jgi:hypothetical protein